jgi:hypothetical protein
VTPNRFARNRAAANDFPAVGGADPERVAVKRNAARFFGLGLKRAQHFTAFVGYQVGFVSGALINDPQAFARGLQTVRRGSW